MRIPALRILKRLYIIKIGKKKKFYKKHKTNDDLKEKLDNIIRTNIYLELH
ncbi:hypothetical protein CF076_08050 [Clostridium botulinum]|nr:hypothetical protein B2H84_08040 [Clostridium botulinum]